MRTTGTLTALNSNHEIFSSLAIDNNPPDWWLKILEDKELYVEIRKDNYINVYYYGGCLIKITYNKVSKKLQTVTHQKYMGNATPVKQDKKGNDVFEYCDCSSQLNDRGYLQFLKENIKDIYLKENQDNDLKLEKNKLTVSSEKKVQGELILKNRNLYIDSEFAYAIPSDLLNPEDKDKLIRIDLVRLDNEMLSFVELKLMDDPRLRGKNIEKSGILHQIKNYRNYIKHYESEFVTYYNKVAEIKHKIGVWKEQPIINGLNTEPTILLVNNYSSETDGRTDRIEDIKIRLEKEKKYCQILDYPICK